MNKIKYIISTPYRNYYEIAENGGVVKYSNGLDKTNATEKELLTWQVLGIAELLPFGNLGRTIPLSKAVKIKNFSFKNGKPKYTGVDKDHGTVRVWGNTKYHGIDKVYLA